MKDLFGRFARDPEYSYDAHMERTGHFAAISRFLDACFPDIKGCRTVLDLATGSGYVPCELHRRSGHFSIVGMDPSPGMLSLAKEKAPRAAFTAQRIADLPKQHFDLVVISYGVCWIDFEEMLADIEALLTPAGKLLIIDDVDLDRPLFIAKRPYLAPLAGKRQKLTLDDLKRILGNGSFSIRAEHRLRVGDTHDSYCLLASKGA